MEIITEIYADGFSAAFDGLQYTACPYDGQAQEQEFDSWLAGWDGYFASRYPADAV